MKLVFPGCPGYRIKRTRRELSEKQQKTHFYFDEFAESSTEQSQIVFR